jgi:flavorubredoxin
MDLNNANFDDAVEISPNIFWVGSGTKSFLNRNSYLRIFKGSGNAANMLIDPGPTSDLDDLINKTTKVLGNIARINLIFINHQDPDVIGNVPYLTRLNPRTVVMASEDTWRLVSLNCSPKTAFKPVERFNNFRVALNTSPSHRMQFIPTPFCHFRGACMVYDLESRILFSGDFMGGIAAVGLEATESNWAGIKAFHQLYMPSNEAIRLAVQRIRKLDPPPLMIAPQHGGIIRGELIDEFLDRMETLQVGLDIITSLDSKLPLLTSALNEIIQTFKTVCGSDVTSQVLRYFQPDGSYPALFAMSGDGNVTDIKGEPVEVVESLIRVFFKHTSDTKQNIMKAKIVRIMLDRNLPPFDLLLAQDESPPEAMFAEMQ